MFFSFLNIHFLFVLDLSNRDEINLVTGVLNTFKNIQIIRLRVENYHLESYSDWHSKHHAYFEKHPWQSISTDRYHGRKEREGRINCKVYPVFTDKELNKLLTLDTFFLLPGIKSVILLGLNVFFGQIKLWIYLDLIHKQFFFSVNKFFLFSL